MNRPSADHRPLFSDVAVLAVTFTTNTFTEAL
jgi:hypothetical protein